MISTIITNLVSFCTNTSWITKIFTVFILWLTPALELFTLLAVIMFVDYLLDLWSIYIKSKPTEDIRGELWEHTKIALTKIFFYTVLVVLMNGLQLHLIKSSFDLFRWVVAIPIISESFSVMSTIEKHTGIKVIDSVKKVFKSMLSREGVDDSIIDDIDESNKKEEGK